MSDPHDDADDVRRFEEREGTAPELLRVLRALRHEAPSAARMAAVAGRLGPLLDAEPGSRPEPALGAQDQGGGITATTRAAEGASHAPSPAPLVAAATRGASLELIGMRVLAGVLALGSAAAWLHAREPEAPRTATVAAQASRTARSAAVSAAGATAMAPASAPVEAYPDSAGPAFTHAAPARESEGVGASAGTTDPEPREQATDATRPRDAAPPRPGTSQLAPKRAAARAANQGAAVLGGGPHAELSSSKAALRARRHPRADSSAETNLAREAATPPLAGGAIHVPAELPAQQRAAPAPSREPAEAELLLEARALARADPRAALGLLDVHAARFPKGVLAPEREVLAIEALRALGQAAAAKQRLEAFRARHPGSAHLRRLER
jgi:hypothetical protein